MVDNKRRVILDFLKENPQRSSKEIFIGQFEFAVKTYF